jgi:arylsulfatase A
MTYRILNLLLLSLAMTNLASTSVSAQNGRKPTVILIMADDLGYECIGANGGSSYKTPNLDKLSACGFRFTNCYVQPLCTPTRLQLMTGMYNVRNYTVFGELHRSQRTFGNLFKEAGYATGIFGKWQLGQDLTLPVHFGFDTYCLWQHRRRPPRYANPGLEIQGEQIDYTDGEYGPELILQHALHFIESNKDKPFFLYYPMILTHDPFQPTPDSPDWDPKREGEQYSDPKHFAEMVSFMDTIIGNIVKKLEETGLRENTLLIFTGDNGTSPQVVSQLNGQEYRGGKGLTTAAGMHVPLIVNFPGKIKPGTICEDLVDSTDFLPTICESAGISLPKEGTLDGISFYPQLLGQKGMPREWIYCWYLGQMEEGQEKICVQNKQYKLYTGGQLFDLIADPLEQSPIDKSQRNAGQQSAAAELQKVLDRYENARPEWCAAQ